MTLGTVTEDTGMIRLTGFLVMVVLGLSTTAITTSLAAEPAPARSRAAATAQMRAQTVLLADDFDDPGAGVLPAESSEPAVMRLGYDAGEYVIATLDPSANRLPVAWLPGVYSDAALAVDVRLPNATDGQHIAVSCRTTLPPERGYRLEVDPINGRFTLARFDDDIWVPLVDWTPRAEIRRGSESNHLELACFGTTIRVRINAVEVASVEDATYQTGEMFIAAGVFASRMPGTVEARFDNLQVIDLSGPQPAREAAAQPTRESSPVALVPTPGPPLPTPATAPLLGPTATPGLPLLGPTPSGPTPTDQAHPGVSGNTYVSPTTGYGLSWDETWSVAAASSEAGGDRLELSNGASQVTFNTLTGPQAGGGDPTRCQDTVGTTFLSPTDRDAVVATATDGAPLRGGDASRAYVVYTYQHLPDAGEPQAFVAYVECRPLVSGDTALLIVHTAPLEAYNTEVPLVQALLGRLVLPPPPAPTTAVTVTPIAAAPPTVTPAAQAAPPPETVSTQAADCPGIDTWFAATQSRSQHADEIIDQLPMRLPQLTLADGPLLIDWGATLVALAEDQRAGPIPPAATDTNTALADALEALGTRLTAAGTKLNSFDTRYLDDVGVIPGLETDLITAQAKAEQVARRCGATP